MTLIIGVIDCFIVFLRLLKINIDRLESFYQSTAEYPSFILQICFYLNPLYYHSCRLKRKTVPLTKTKWYRLKMWVKRICQFLIMKKSSHNWFLFYLHQSISFWKRNLRRSTSNLKKIMNDNKALQKSASDLEKSRDKLIQ